MPETIVETVEEAPTSMVVKKYATPLLVTLTQEEQVERGRALSRTLEDHRNEESQQEMQKRAMKSRLAEIEAKRDELSLVVSRGKELRDVECEDIANYLSGRMTSVRLDTGEVIHERALNEQERQISAL